MRSYSVGHIQAITESSTNIHLILCSMLRVHCALELERVLHRLDLDAFSDQWERLFKERKESLTNIYYMVGTSKAWYEPARE